MNTEERSVKVKRKVHRSPNYPSLSLGEAIDRVRQIYDAEKRTPAGADTILAHLGYKPGVGPGVRALSALRQYGLLEERGGLDRISDSAFHILTLSEGSPDRVTALRDAARQPALFRQLLEYYNGQLPSDVNLRDHLIKMHSFNPESVATFIKTFRETVELAKLYPNDENGREAEPVQANADEGGNPSHKPSVFGVFSEYAKDPEGTLRKLAGAGEQEFISVPLSSGVRARVLMSGGTVGVKDIEKLIRVLKLQKELLADDSTAGEGSSQSDDQETK